MKKIIVLSFLGLIFFSPQCLAMDEPPQTTPPKKRPLPQNKNSQCDEPDKKRQRGLQRGNARSGTSLMERLTEEEQLKKLVEEIDATIKEKHDGVMPSKQGMKKKGLSFCVSRTRSPTSTPPLSPPKEAFNNYPLGQHHRRIEELIDQANQTAQSLNKTSSSSEMIVTAQVVDPPFKVPTTTHRPHQKTSPEYNTPPRPGRQGSLSLKSKPKPGQNPQRKPQG